MLTRNDNPIGSQVNFSTDGNFNFAVDSVFNANNKVISSGIVEPNRFLLLQGGNLNLLGTGVLLLLE